MERLDSEIILKGEHVRLIPLTGDHRNDLLTAASDGQLWKLWYTSVPSKETVDIYLATALKQKEIKVSYPFAIISQEDNKVIGTTRYCNIDRKNRRVEIGYTWYAKSYQKTMCNTEAKFLLLQFAFESLAAVVVEFRTHWHNHASRNAILRLGAKQDGVLRNHRLDAQGRHRDTVVFSIIENEWSTVAQSLQFKLDR